MNLNDLFNKGFMMNNADRRVRDISILSLKIGLKSYFSTYKTSGHRFDSFVNPEIWELTATQHDNQHHQDYIESYVECIIHFHHFIELAIKDILRNEHQLLSIKNVKPVIMHKLLKGETLTESEEKSVGTLEFKGSQERLNDLIKDGRLGQQYEFFRQNKNLLEKLNNLRNRILHRGIYVLKYTELDMLVGVHILPLIEKILNLPQYLELRTIWKYRELDCAIDPIDEIIEEFKGQEPNYYKVALLKEMGRAAYENPYINSNALWGSLTSDYKDKAEAYSNYEMINDNVNKIKICPVCGVESLVEKFDWDTDIDEDGNEIPFKIWTTNCCNCCGFEVMKPIENGSQYGLALIDFWNVID